MRLLSIAVAAAWTAVCSCMVVADPYRLMAPDDPAFRSGWRVPAPPTADLKAYHPVDAGNWLEPNASGGAGAEAHGTPGASAPTDMKGMPGMEGMPGMKGMPGMEHGK